MKNSVFWDITSCSLLRVKQHFRGICPINLQGRRISHARNQLYLLTASLWLLVWLILLPWRWRRHGSPKRRLASNELHLVISQKI
jgi:hypothetical protein